MLTRKQSWLIQETWRAWKQLVHINKQTNKQTSKNNSNYWYNSWLVVSKWRLHPNNTVNSTGNPPRYKPYYILYLHRYRITLGCLGRLLTCLSQMGNWTKEKEPFLSLAHHLLNRNIKYSLSYLYFKLWSSLVATPTNPRRLNTTWWDQTVTYISF